MAKVGFPAIQPPGTLELRSLQQLADNTRERFAAVEAFATQINSILLSSQANAKASTLQQQIDQLKAQINALEGSLAVDDLENLLANEPNGLVVLANGHLITRVLRAGESIVIVNADGVAGDPIIGVKFTEATPFTQEAWPWNTADDTDHPLLIDEPIGANQPPPLPIDAWPWDDHAQDEMVE
jgi:hypothetical protein